MDYGLTVDITLKKEIDARCVGLSSFLSPLRICREMDIKNNIYYTAPQATILYGGVIGGFFH